MKATLDHVGIAVGDLAAALAFFRDALGLEVEAPEEVASQRVRAHFIPLGESQLELLEATAADSPIARFVNKRGAGLHHITLRVDDLHAALTRLTAHGVRLIDTEPRPGAEGALVAFVHPTSAHGVLVELSERPPDAHTATGSDVHAIASGLTPASRSTRFAIGDLELISLCDGFIRLDGGAMFGVVPKTKWARQAPPDDANRIMLAMRPLIVRGARTMLIDAGLGDKDDEKFRRIYGVDRTWSLDHALAAAGLTVSDIDLVLATHLHFDHAGGFTERGADGRVGPRFPRAQYVVRRGEWEDAVRPSVRTRASYLRDNFEPLAQAGVLQLVEDDQTIMPGVRVQRTGGHTKHHQMVWIESRGETAAYPADLMPMTPHLAEPWIMGYDLFPLETLASKQAFITEAMARSALVFFEHDPVVVAGRIRERAGTRIIEAVAGSD